MTPEGIDRLIEDDDLLHLLQLKYLADTEEEKERLKYVYYKWEASLIFGLANYEGYIH